MLNQVVLVGRLANEPTRENIYGKEIANIKLACPRSYKNSDGLYDTDFIDITLWNDIAKNILDYCKNGDVIGVKGRIQTENSLNIDNSMSNKLVIIAEKVSFLSSKSNN